MKHIFLFIGCLGLISFQGFSEIPLAAGRAKEADETLEVYLGFGQLSSLSGSVLETRGAGVISGGLNTDLRDLNIDDGSETTLFGGKIAGRWLTLLLDIRNNTIDASGTAENDIRINVDGVSFGSRELEYLLIPVGSDYTVDAESTWLGVGLQLTPITVNPGGRFRFIPWLHVGFQYVDTSFDIDSGNTIGLDIPGFGNRVFAIQGQAQGDAQLIIPEYGFGGEVRVMVSESLGIEVVAGGTFKILSFEGALSDLGFDDDDFEDLSIDYTALNLNLDIVYPVSDVVSLSVGLFTEQVDADIDLDAKPTVGSFRREVDGEYTLNGIRFGVRF